MPEVNNQPFVLALPILVPPEVNPSVLLEGRYKPVVVLPRKLTDGAPALPVAKVIDVALVKAKLLALYTFLPSQISITVVFWLTVAVDPPDTPVDMVNV